jgi:hypothetical protein
MAGSQVYLAQPNPCWSVAKLCRAAAQRESQALSANHELVRRVPAAAGSVL